MALWNTVLNGTPPNTDTPKRIAAMVRELKLAIYNRIKNEHENYNSATTGSEATDWWHKEGSAKTYIDNYGGVAAFSGPEYRPDGTTLLDTEDAGRICIDTNGGLYQQYIWSGTAWVGMGGLPIGTIHFQLSGTSNTNDIFLGTWTYVSTSYAGRFFRVEGGNAATFSATTISTSQQDQSVYPHTHSTTVIGTTATTQEDYDAGYLWDTGTGGRRNTKNTAFTSSSYGATETRPINVTIKVWKRTA